MSSDTGGKGSGDLGEVETMIGCVIPASDALLESKPLKGERVAPSIGEVSVLTKIDAADSDPLLAAALYLVEKVRAGQLPDAHCGVFDEDPNSLSLGDMLAVHLDLLVNGWRPLRWRHSEMSDQEVIADRGFWYTTAWDGSHVGVRWGVKNGLHDGDVAVVRGPDGVLVATKGGEE